MHEFVIDRPGPLAFPVTPFTGQGDLDLDAFRRHLERLVAHDAAALFVACGTGEFAALAPEEVERLVRAAVEVSRGRTPVYAATGGAIAVATSIARAAAGAGAGGLLVLPPYLSGGEQAGLEAYYRRLAASTDLGLILYQRDDAVFEPHTVERLVEIENVVGFKDGLGDMERLTRILSAVSRPITFFNGMPTAETYQPAYRALGVEQYSSAVFNFVPEVSWAFYRAEAAGDRPAVESLLRAFFLPLTELRRRVRGYAVALVKTGVGLRYEDVGPVRPPLVDTARPHVAELEQIISAGLAEVDRMAELDAVRTADL